MSWVAVAIGGGALVGAIGSNMAANTQAAGQKQAAATQAGMLNTILGYQQPFIQSGYAGSSVLDQLLGISGPMQYSGGYQSFPGGGTSSSGYSIGAGGSIHPIISGGAQTGAPSWGGPQLAGRGDVGGWTPRATGPAQGGVPLSNMVAGTGLPNGYLTQPFNPTQEQLQNYPGYQFQLNQGDLALQSANAPGLGALSGPALKQLISFNQGLAGTNYGNYFNQYQTQQQNIFNRLYDITGLGQAGAAATAGPAAQLGSGIAGAQAAAAGSQAAGIVGATNSIAGNAVPLAYLLANNGGGYDFSGEYGGGSTAPAGA